MVELVIDKTNLVAQILLNGANEVLGDAYLQEVIEPALPGETGMDDPTAQVDALLSGLQDRYSVPVARGLALRIGRAAFRYAFQQIAEQAGFRSMEYRLLPAPRRLESGLGILARLLDDEAGEGITISDEGAAWEWHEQKSFLCQASPASNLGCFLTAGLLQEFASWAGGGRFYKVMETACRASGDPRCVYRIEKKPLD